MSISLRRSVIAPACSSTAACNWSVKPARSPRSPRWSFGSRASRNSRGRADLFPMLGEDGGRHEDPAQLVDLLRARFGPEVCCAIAPADDHRPEHAWAPVAPQRSPGRAAVHARRGRCRLGRALSGCCRRPARSPCVTVCRSSVGLCSSPSRTGADRYRLVGALSSVCSWYRARPDRPGGRPEADGLHVKSEPQVAEPRAAEPEPRAAEPRAAEPRAAESLYGADTDSARRSDPYEVAEAVFDSAAFGPAAGGEDAPPQIPATLAIAPPAPRDYWVSRHADGSHYWIYRDLADGRWFLHGIFA